MEPYSEYLYEADTVISVSRFLEDQVLKLGLPKARSHVIYDEVDTRYFSGGVLDPQEARTRLGIAPAKKVVVTIARFAPNKRHDLLLAAMSIVRETVPEVELVLKGEVFYETSYVEAVRDDINKRGLSDIVKIIPFVDDIRDLHAAADVVVLCSDREGLGRCVVEAMAMGTPVVVTDSGGTHEVVNHRKTGFVVRGGDARDLATRIVEALTAPDRCREIIRAARDFVEEHLTARASANRIMEIYERIVRKRGAGRGRKRVGSGLVAPPTRIPNPA
jgi:1,4-alpha-glucan branching enzyme